MELRRRCLREGTVDAHVMRRKGGARAAGGVDRFKTRKWGHSGVRSLYVRAPINCSFRLLVCLGFLTRVCKHESCLAPPKTVLIEVVGTDVELSLSGNIPPF